MGPYRIASWLAKRASGESKVGREITRREELRAFVEKEDQLLQCAS
jgi:hypothetical protein